MTYVFVVLFNGNLLEVFHSREGAEAFVKRNIMQGQDYKIHHMQVRHD